MVKSLAVAVAMMMLTGGARRIYEVTRVDAKLDGNRITVHAAGNVTTGGWKNAKLVQTSKTATTLTFSFEATPPDGMVMQVITPAAATVTTGALTRPFPTKVKVVAQTNAKTASVAK